MIEIADYCKANAMTFRSANESGAIYYCRDGEKWERVADQARYAKIVTEAAGIDLPSAKQMAVSA